MAITEQELLKHPSKGPLSKVRAAREILRERAMELIESYIALAAEAKAAGKWEVAEEALWKLIDHIPKEDAVGIIDSASSKVQEVSGSRQPTIQIGIALGGVGQSKELPPIKVIDVDPNE